MHFCLLSLQNAGYFDEEFDKIASIFFCQAEALFLYGVMLLVTELRIDGIAREKILVSYYRYRLDIKIFSSLLVIVNSSPSGIFVHCNFAFMFSYF